MFKNNNIIEEFNNLPIQESYSDKPNNIGKWNSELKKQSCYNGPKCMAIGCKSTYQICSYYYILDFKNR
jgi:hypothetical protein